MAADDPAVRSALQLDNTSLLASINKAYDRAVFVIKVFNKLNAQEPLWQNISQAKKDDFMSGTGLSASAAETIWNDIIPTAPD